MDFFNSIKQVKANWQPYKKWEAEQDNKEFQRQDLHKKVQTSKEDLERASQYGRTLIESINIMDQYATDKAQDVEMSSKFAMEGVLLVLSVLGGGIGLMASKKPSVKNYLEKLMPNNKAFQKQVVSVVPTIALPMLFFPFVIAKFASYEKEAARTARYQAREDKLKDPKNFVIYDKEQLNKAKEIAKTLPDSIEKKKSELNPIANYNDSIKSVKTIIKDHKNYIKWKEDHLNKEKVKIDNFDNLFKSFDVKSYDEINIPEFDAKISNHANICKNLIDKYFGPTENIVWSNRLIIVNLISSQRYAISEPVPGAKINSIFKHNQVPVYVAQLAFEILTILEYGPELIFDCPEEGFLDQSEESIISTRNKLKDSETKLLSLATLLFASSKSNRK